MTEVIKRFTKKRKTEDIEIEENDGSIGKYTIKELEGTQRQEFIRLVSSRMKPGPDGQPTSLESTGELEIKLIAASVYDPSGKLVTEQEVLQWPSTIITGIFEISSHLSALDQ